MAWPNLVLFIVVKIVFIRTGDNCAFIDKELFFTLSVNPKHLTSQC